MSEQATKKEPKKGVAAETIRKISGQAEKMSISFESLITDSLYCKLNASYKIDYNLFDECLEGLPVYTNCLISNISDGVQHSYFIPQGEIFSRKALPDVFKLEGFLDIRFLDVTIADIPLFAITGLPILDLQDTRLFAELRRTLDQENIQSTSFLGKNIAHSTVEKIIYYIIREYKAHKAAAFQYFSSYFNEPRLFNILTLIHTNMNEEIKLEHLGELAGLSPDYVSQFFKRSVGMSIQNYMIDQRVKKGLFHLIVTGKQIWEIADVNGFIDQAYFNRRFKASYNINPLRLRKQYQLFFISGAGALLMLAKR